MSESGDGVGCALGGRWLCLALGASGALVLLSATFAAAAPLEPVQVAGIPIDFILFALTLLGVALFHHHTLRVALIGPRRHHALQARLHRLQVRRRACRPRRCTCSTNG